MSTGTDLINTERQRQIKEKGWTEEHDDVHDGGELALASMYYACPDSHKVLISALWPEYWNTDFAKKGQSTRIRDLEKAGAMLAAEIDRLQRLGQTRIE